MEKRQGDETGGRREEERRDREGEGGPTGARLGRFGRRTEQLRRRGVLAGSCGGEAERSCSGTSVEGDAGRRCLMWLLELLVGWKDRRRAVAGRGRRGAGGSGGDPEVDAGKSGGGSEDP